jgi:hypothetical protein
LAPGAYTFNLDDSAMFALSGRHAKVIFSGNGVDVTLNGQTGDVTSTSELEKQSSKSNDDDDEPITSSLGFIIGVAVGGVVLLLCIVFVVW